MLYEDILKGALFPPLNQCPRNFQGIKYDHGVLKTMITKITQFFFKS